MKPCLKPRKVIRQARHAQPGQCCQHAVNYERRSDGARCRVCGTVWNRAPEATEPATAGGGGF